MLYREGAYVYALRLNITSYKWKVGECYHRRIVREMPSDIVIGFVVFATAEQLEVTAPVIVPSLGQVLVVEVGEVEEVISRLVCIETCPGTHVE